MVKEDPDMRAKCRTGAFHKTGHRIQAADIYKSFDICDGVISKETEKENG